MKIKGKLIILPKPGRIKIEDFELNSENIKPKEVIAKTLYSAISPGSEKAAYVGKPALKPGKSYPRLVGYCNVAEVIYIGSRVKTLRKGDMILTGESHRSIFKISESDIWVKLPKKIDPKDATLAYPYNLGLCSLEAVKTNKKISVAVIGLGISGLGAIEQAKIFGHTASAFSDSAYKLKLAKKLGAKEAFLKNKSANLEKTSDLVITTSNSWKDWKLALRLVKPYGVISVLGFPGRDGGAPNFNPLEPKYFYAKKIAIIPTGWLQGSEKISNVAKMNKNNLAKILNMIKNKKLHPKNLISGIYDYRDIERAYKKLLAKDGQSVTYLLKWPK